MRNFIKNHTPEWWTGWCWFGLFMLVWSIGWALFGNNPASRGFQAGVAIFWFHWLIVQFGTWYQRDTIRIHRELNDLNNKIIRKQRETIALKNETIVVQNDHINFLKGQPE